MKKQQDQSPGLTIQSIKYQSTLIINEGLRINFTQKRPNFVWRLLQRLVFGFKWEKLK